MSNMMKEMTDLEKRLKQDAESLPILDVSSGTNAERTWKGHCNRLRTNILEDDPREMLKWWIICHTMNTTGHANWATMYMTYLHDRPDWEDRWFKAIKDPGFGHPTPLTPSRHTSLTIIGHAYQLAQFEARTGVQIDNMSYIFEFGGGYGAMARLVHNLGYEGDYLDYDLPIFKVLTEYYLDSTGPHNVLCLSDLGALSATIKENDHNNALFLSTWALSEVPRRLRMQILSLVRNYKYFLITYQPEFKNVNNEEFFRDWQNETDGVSWQTYEIGNVGSHVLIGVRND